MGIYMEHFRCVELISEKSEISHYPTRWGAARRCHDLNIWNPRERWTVRPIGVRYVSDYNELTPRSFKEGLARHFESQLNHTINMYKPIEEINNDND